MLARMPRSLQLPVSFSTFTKFLIISQAILTIFILSSLYGRDSCSPASIRPLRSKPATFPPLLSESSKSPSLTSALDKWWPSNWGTPHGVTEGSSNPTATSPSRELEQTGDEEIRVGYNQSFFSYGFTKCLPPFTKPMLQEAIDRYISCTQYAPFEIQETQRVAFASITTGRRQEAYDRAIQSQMFHAAVHDSTIHVLCEQLSEGPWNKIGTRIHSWID